MELDINNPSHPLHALWQERAEDVKHVEELITSLGADPKKHGRRVARSLRAIVSEVYSPPRITKAAKLLPEYGVVPGLAFDLTVNDEDGRPWDFNIPAQRRRAREMLEQQRPLLLVGSPMCTAFSTWQAISTLKGYVAEN